jgi:hypothetical protein
VNPWFQLGTLVLWVSSVVGVGIWQHGAGENAERVHWQNKTNFDLEVANRKIKDLTEQYRRSEQDKAVAVQSITAQLEQEKRDGLAEKDRVIAQLRDGSLRLRDKYAKSSGACRDNMPKTPSDTASSNGASGTELSEEAAEFLWSEATRANKVVSQLVACQAVLVEDRR